MFIMITIISIISIISTIIIVIMIIIIIIVIMQLSRPAALTGRACLRSRPRRGEGTAQSLFGSLKREQLKRLTINLTARIGTLPVG